MAGPLRIEMVANVDAGHFTGSTTHVFEMASNLARRNSVRLWIAAQDLAQSDIWGGFETRFFGGRTSGSGLWWPPAALRNEAALLAGLLRAALAQRPDAIYVRETYTLAPGIVARIFRIPLLIEVNVPVLYAVRRRGGGAGAWLRAAVIKAHARMASVVLPITPLQCRYVAEQYGVPPDRVRMMPNGANLDLFRPADQGAAQRELGLDPGLEYVLWAGSVRRIADLTLLLRAVALVAAKREAVRLLLLSPAIEQLRPELAKLGLDDKTVLRSVAYANVHRYYAAADLALATWEDSDNARVNGASPLKVYEYMGSARPVVAADLPDLEFVAREGLGLLYKPGDADDLARRIDEALSLPPASRSEMGLRGRAYAERYHDWAKTALLVEDAIRELRGC